MPIDGIVPGAVVSAIAIAATACVMFHLGLGVAPREFRAAWREPGPMGRALFASLVAVPAIAIVVARTFGLPRGAEIGLVLAAISPGAPIAVRRALGGGAPAAFVATLQLSEAALAVVSMPLTVFLLDEVYAGSAAVAPATLARQVLVFQLLPAALGVAAGRAWGERLRWIERLLPATATALVALLVAVVLVDAYPVASEVRGRTAAAIVVAVVLAIAAGHALGGPSPRTRTGVAVAAGARNIGLAMLVASINRGPPEVPATILAFFFVSAIALAPYLAWRRRQNRNLP